MSRRALLVTWHFPPSTAVGARRPAQLAAGLPDEGWEVVVLCPRPAGGVRDLPHVVETPRARPSEWVRAVLPLDERPLFEQVTGAPSQQPAGGDRRLLPRVVRQARSLLVFPDEHAPWIAAALAVADRRLGSEHFDVVVSTTPPFSAAVAGAAIARRFGCPHVADVRDPFTLNAIWPPGRLDAPLRRSLEARVLDDAARVVTVSNGFAAKQRTLTSTSIEVLHNAWDDKDVVANTAAPADGAITLVHSGTIYPATADLVTFAEGLAASGRALRLVNCGKSGSVLKRALAQAGLPDILDDRGVVSRSEAAQLRAAAHGLVVFLPSRDDDDGHIPAKLFDYLGARKPILAVGSSSSEPARLLEGLRTDGVCASATDVARWVAEAPTHALLPPGGEQEVSAAALCRRYADVLNDVVAP